MNAYPNNQHHDPSGFTIFELSLDASSDISGLTVAIQALSRKVVDVRVDIYNSFTPRWTEEGVVELFEALGSAPQFLKLEFYGLRIFPYQVPITMVEKTLSRADQLQEISLVGIQVSGSAQEFDNFSEALKRHPSLKSFCLDNCKLENEAEGPRLDGAVIRALPEIYTLERVLIRAMERTAWGTLSSDSVDILCSSPTLKELELFVFSEDNCCDHFLLRMAKALIQSKDRTQLTQLSISGSLGGLDGSRAISEMLKCNKTLRSLEIHLSGLCAKDEAGLMALSRALACNNTLTSFQLYGRTDPTKSLHEELHEAFIQMLQTNYSLVDSVQVFSPAFLRPESEFYCKLNQRGRGRLLGNENATKEEWVNTLINVRDDLPCLYYFLSRNPLLCAPSPVTVTDDSFSNASEKSVKRRAMSDLESNDDRRKHLRFDSCSEILP